MQPTSTWIIEELSWDSPHSVQLRAAQRTELDIRYSGNHEPGTQPSAKDVAFFVVALDRDTSTAMACGGLRRLDDAHAEIKRMYVTPDARGTGLAAAILRALESAALERGWTTLRLETGNRQPEAERFYQREGYHRIPRFGAYVDSDISVCYERRLI